MSSGLLALLDDVVAIAKVAAASVDDTAALAAKAGAKSAGVVIDDAAVTPRYVVGFTAERELPIIYKITRGSLRNKLLVLLPGALILSLLAPWAITPILMFGGLFLCFEGAEKVLEMLHPHAHGHGEGEVVVPGTPEGLEDQRVASAIKTDFILSAEIMAITLSAVPEASFWQQAMVLALVGTGITLVVYGSVALIVKADDVGVAMSQRGRLGLTRSLGRGIVHVMPGFLKLLATIGTVAMLWVGGGILLHGAEVLGLAGPAHLVHDTAHALGQLAGGLQATVSWLVTALLSVAVGFVLGLILVPIVTKAVVPMVRGLRGSKG
ncbi:DUF808 domain-containing protein [Fluviibacterium sp. DFM31]|uniref:DUF808 domain-containing protein n=1 Tax=Meridianimarinicoccus marinus TaxID=3231483 RepID=A0ABV3L298_9RHOB